MQDRLNQIRFLCDEMLIGLARWLRAAGYDTEVCDLAVADRSILEYAINDNRVLITRDQKLMEYRHADNIVLYLNCNDIESCVKDLDKKAHINWLLDPFSRCMQCNTPLVEADPDKLARVPDESRKLAHPLLYCPTCDKVYWEGSHVDRMRQKLTAWSHN